jgi:hypothetical protein
MNKENKFLPEGFRFLKIGEQIKKEDYFWNNKRNRWIKVHFDADTSNWVEEHLIRKTNDKDN